MSVRGSLLYTSDPLGTRAGPPPRPLLATGQVFRQHAPTQGETPGVTTSQLSALVSMQQRAPPGLCAMLSAVGGGTGREGDLKTHTATVVTLGARTSILGAHSPVATPQAWRAAGMALPGVALPGRVGAAVLAGPVLPAAVSELALGSVAPEEGCGGGGGRSQALLPGESLLAGVTEPRHSLRAGMRHR